MKLHAFHCLVVNIFGNVGKLFLIEINLTKSEVLAPTNCSKIVIPPQSHSEARDPRHMAISSGFPNCFGVINDFYNL